MFTIKNYAARVLIPMSDVYVCDVFIRVSDFNCGSRCFPHFFHSLSAVFPEFSPVFEVPTHVELYTTTIYTIYYIYILYTIDYILYSIYNPLLLLYTITRTRTIVIARRRVIARRMDVIIVRTGRARRILILLLLLLLLLLPHKRKSCTAPRDGGLFIVIIVV